MYTTEFLKFINKAKALGKSSLSTVNDCFLVSKGRISASNLESSLSMEVSTVDKEKSFLVPKESLEKLCKALKNEVLTLKEGSITHNRGVFNFSSSYKVDDWPTEHDLSKVEYEDVALSDLPNIITASKFTANDELRPVLNNVYLNNDHVVSSNKHTIFFPETKSSLKEGGYLIPKYITAKLDADTPLKIGRTPMKEKGLFGGIVAIKQGIFMYIFSETEGFYPNYRRVLPMSNSYFIEADKKEVLSNLNLLGISAHKNSEGHRVIIFQNEKMISNNVDTGESQELKTLMKTNGEGFRFMLSKEYLELVLKSIGSKTVLIQWGETDRVFLINKIVGIMPTSVM